MRVINYVLDWSNYRISYRSKLKFNIIRLYSSSERKDMNDLYDENENKISYYAVIPATVLFNENLKANEKLLYALITSLSNKEGYCYASNKYLGEKLKFDSTTISRWITNLRKNNFLFEDIIRNELKIYIESEDFLV